MTHKEYFLIVIDLTTGTTTTTLMVLPKFERINYIPQQFDKGAKE